MSAAGGDRLASAGGLHGQGPRRRHDGHLGRHRPSDQLRPGEGRIPSSRTSTPGRRARSCPRPSAAQTGMQTLAELGFIVVQIDGMGTANRSKAFHDVGLPEPRRCRIPGPHPLAQGGRGEVSVLRHHPRGHLRHVGRRPELDGRGAVPSGVLQGGGIGRRLPRQPDGQDLVERAVDGMAARAALCRVVERGQRRPASGRAAADRRRDGHQRGPVVDACRWSTRSSKPTRTSNCS